MLYFLLCAVIAVLSAKIILMKRAVRALANDFSDRVSSDTNTLIYTDSRDRDLCRLADVINTELRILRREHHRYTQGDRELKTAITNISHDLRTPLTAICGYLDILKETELPPQTAQHLAVIENRAAMMKQLTEELFTYSVILSQSTEDNTEEVAVNQVLEESIIGLYAAFQARDIIPQVHIPEEKIIRNVNRAALSRVFSNLLTNAAKYSDGDLDISMDSECTITFENTSALLTQIQVERLFERFYTVEAARNSTGLGLSIAKTLTEQMGGTLEASYENHRLCITFKLKSSAGA